jgi:hypothetical protein
MSKILYTPAEAAEQVGVTEDDIRLAINQSDAESKKDRFKYPPLRAKTLKRGKTVILHDDLVEWARSLPDA